MNGQPSPLFVLDSDVIIGAYRNHYAPDICPGFWDCIPLYFQSGHLISIERVFDEIQNPGDLVQWAQNAPSGLFAFSGEQPAITAYGTVMDWVQNSSQFKPEAKRKFAAGADGWLVAYAQIHSAVVVTQEVSAPEAKNKVPIPDVCRVFGVDYVNSWEMLRQLGVRFILEPTA